MAWFSLFRYSISGPTLLIQNVQKSVTSCADKTAAMSRLFVPVKPDFKLMTYRYSHSFFSRTTAEQLWKGVTSVSVAGLKKGRGKRLVRRAVDLNRGQVIGFGKKGMLWPGLNSPVIRGKEVITQQPMPPDESREQRIIDYRNQHSVRRRPKLSPLERGYSGTKLPGRSLGPPAPIGDEMFEGFDSRCLEFKMVMKGHPQKGKERTLSAFVVIGNKKGLAGFALYKSPNGMTAAHNARNRAAQVLRYIQRYKEHTILHDFHATYGAVTVIARRKQAGFGLVCHRCIRSICEMIGIKDIYCKVYGPTQNYQNLTKAFFIGLMQQKTPQELSEEKGLHVIELKKERDYFPEVIASPRKCRTKEEIDINEILDYNLYTFDGKVTEFIKPYEPYYKDFPSHIKKTRDVAFLRNKNAVTVQLMARYDGKFTTFLNIRKEEQMKAEAEKEMETAECIEAEIDQQ